VHRDNSSERLDFTRTGLFYGRFKLRDTQTPPNENTAAATFASLSGLPLELSQNSTGPRRERMLLNKKVAAAAAEPSNALARDYESAGRHVQDLNQRPGENKWHD
jgi:hypothetical protein